MSGLSFRLGLSCRSVIPFALVSRTIPRTLSRKEFLALAGAGVAGHSLLGTAGCGLTPGKEGKMNVVVVILDSLRRDHVGAYGNSWIRTPNLDVLAKDSLRFTRPYAESYPTIPARRAIHTGIRTFPFRNWIPQKDDNVKLYGWQRIPEEQTTLAEILFKEGYETMLVTDTEHQFKSSMNFQRGFSVFDYIRGQTTDHYRPYYAAPRDQVADGLLRGNPTAMKYQLSQYFSNNIGRRSEADWLSPQVFTRASEFLEVAESGKPFFLVVDSYDPHEPWDPPEEYLELYADGAYDGKEPYWPLYGASQYLREPELQRLRTRYAAEVTMVDHWLGRFLGRMDDLGLFENTLFMLLSDHGVGLGEHGVSGKPAYALWPEIMDIVFLLRHPDGTGAGETSDYFASTHDVAPTILSALGIERPEAMEGQNLLPTLEGKVPDKRPYFTAAYDNYVWARDDRHAMFSRNDFEEARLYDIIKDPKMNNDIYGRDPGTARRMFQDYVLKDAGGPLPNYTV